MSPIIIIVTGLIQSQRASFIQDGVSKLKLLKESTSSIDQGSWRAIPSKVLIECICVPSMKTLACSIQE